jgi:hypothetical protein
VPRDTAAPAGRRDRPFRGRGGRCLLPARQLDQDRSRCRPRCRAAQRGYNKSSPAYYGADPQKPAERQPRSHVNESKNESKLPVLIIAAGFDPSRIAADGHQFAAAVCIARRQVPAFAVAWRAQPLVRDRGHQQQGRPAWPANPRIRELYRKIARFTRLGANKGKLNHLNDSVIQCTSPTGLFSGSP